MYIKRGFFIFSVYIFIMVFASSCKPGDENLAPFADFTISPYAGNTETIFSFNSGTSSDDRDSIELLQYRWDWESDKRWDTDWASDTIYTHRYKKGGTYQITLEVKDSDGAVSSYFEFIEVNPFYLVDIRDQKEYRTIEIGDQLWMAENLQYNTMYESWCYLDSLGNCEEYGRLYSWNSAQLCCPPGWKLPSQEDWMVLFSFVGDNPGDLLRSRSGWNSDHNGLDSYGFDAKPSSFRRDYGEYSATDSYAYFWTSDSYNNEMGYSYLMFYNRPDIELNYLSKQTGFSVRCLRY